MKIVVLTGAGMSAESGISTFRDQNGLWEGHDVMQVASPEGFKANPELVLEFYNQRRAQLKEVDPNQGHFALAQLEKHHVVKIITQNVDDLHERAGSSSVLHLHGELRKVRSTKDPTYVTFWTEDLNLGDLCPSGGQLRPHVVWFTEDVPMFEKAVQEVSDAEVIIIVGTSMQVYPAASLVGYAPTNAAVYYIDVNPSINYELTQRSNLKVMQSKASEGLLGLLETFSK